MKGPYPKRKTDDYQSFLYPVDKKVYLNKPTEFSKDSFVDVILSRRSEMPKTSLKSQELSDILFLSNRIEDVFSDELGFLHSYRVCPSGGARHPIDILIYDYNSVDNVLSYYNPLDHTLNPLIVDKSALESFVDKVKSNSDVSTGTLIWFAIQFGKTASKYENPESLYWRDLGALLYSIQLVSTFYKCKSCPIGSLVPVSFYELMKSEKLISGGGIILGH